VLLVWHQRCLVHNGYLALAEAWQELTSLLIIDHWVLISGYDLFNHACRLAHVHSFSKQRGSIIFLHIILKHTLSFHDQVLLDEALLCFKMLGSDKMSSWKGNESTENDVVPAKIFK